MKLTVQNLGRIARAELDVRPLTIFVGPNNTNKTWVAYCVYGLAQQLTFDASRRSKVEREPLDMSAFPEHPVLAKQIQTIVQRIADASFRRPTPSDLSIIVPREELLSGLEGEIRLGMDAREIMNLLCLQRKPADDTRVWLDLSASELHAGPFDSLRIEVEDQARTISATPHAPKGIGRSSGATRSFIVVDDDRARMLLLRSTLSAFSLCLYQHVAVLPAERKALVQTYKLLRPEFEKVMASPVVAFAELLQKAERLIPTEGQINALRWAWMPLEQRILGAPLHFSPRDAGPSFTFGDRPESALPIHAASSLVRALAGLDVYLKYFASPGDLLIIDEPEMNAHPEAQLAIAELLAMLVNGGIRVVFTTHSPYIIDHINNLVEASQVNASKQDALASRFRLGTTDAFLSPEKVAVYLFEESGEVRSIYDMPERSVDWRTFSSVSDKVGNLYSDVLAAERPE